MTHFYILDSIFTYLNRELVLITYSKLCAVYPKELHMLGEHYIEGFDSRPLTGM